MINIKDIDSRNVLNYVSIKYYKDDLYKMTVFKRPVNGVHFTVKKTSTRNNEVNEEKLKNNLIRAKSKVFEYAICNDFDYFVTMTIDKEKYDRYDWKSYYKDLSKFLNNYNTNHKTKVEYLLIPEQHKDGAWHVHGLLKGVLDKHLINNNNNYLDWKQYSKKFGYISLGKIKNQEACSKYITKYISKELGTDIELGIHSYYVSRGLKKAYSVKKGSLHNIDFDFDFENEHVRVKWLKNNSDFNLINCIE